MEDEIQCHGQLDGGIWLLLYWGWCKCRYKKQTVASLLQLVLALLGRCAMWVCGKLECLLLLRSASSSEEYFFFGKPVIMYHTARYRTSFPCDRRQSIK